MVEEVLKTPWPVVWREKAWSHRTTQLGGVVPRQMLPVEGQPKVTMTLISMVHHVVQTH